MYNAKSSSRGFLMLLGGGFFYSLYGVFSRVIGDSIPQFYQIWSRAVIILLLIFLLIVLTKTTLKKIRRQDWVWGLIIACSSGLLLPLFYIAVNNLAIGTTLFAFYATGTVVSYILGKILLKETLSRVKIFSLSVALVGLLLLFMDTIQLGNIQYLIFAALSGVLFGLNINSAKKINNIYPTLQVNLFNWVGALLINIIISLFLTEHISVDLTSQAWLANIALALCSLAASISVIYGFKFIEMQRGSIILLSELIFGILLGVLLYNEIPTITAAIGSILIFVALLLPNINVFFRVREK